MYQNGICFITDRTYCTLSPCEMVSAALRAGITFIQYRDKDRTRREIFDEAIRLRALTRSYGAILIVNDFPDIAMAINADGVHLGQDDFPLKEARRIMGNRLVGISTHSLKQAKEAEYGGADYIGYGPVFITTTKAAGPAKGVDNLALITQNVLIPVIAIGGITSQNAESVFRAGAEGIAVATCISRGEIEKNAVALSDMVRKIS